VARQVAPYLGVGVSLAVTVLVALWLGHAADRRFGTEPVGVLVGAVLGLLGAFYHFYKLYASFTSRK
jgi:F0F1-type ATP synthase assembly protein I